MTIQRYAVGAALCLLAAPGGVCAQQPAQRQLDSLGAEIRALKARLDNLRSALARGQRAAPVPVPKATAAGDELAQRRAAAAAAAGTDTTRAQADTASPTRVIGRERSQPQLNPEISVTGDVRAYAQRPGIQRDNFDPREFEVGFQSPLDPYSSTKIFVSLENGTVSVEEGYAYWTGLPGHIRFDIGKFRQQFGELNRWHLHAVPETEYPVALRAYLGDDGLAGTTYKLGQRWIVGVRYDYVENPLSSLITRQITPTVTLWESEWVELRAQYAWARTAGLAASHQLALQAVWAIGPHKHETY